MVKKKITKKPSSKKNSSTNNQSYNNYISRLGEEYTRSISAIEAIFNFDYGPELEIALLDVLSKILPEKYGICRGFLIDNKGNNAGDDLIIYDILNSPKLREHSRSSALKTQIPVEGAYAYIEVKNTLIIEGKDSNFKKSLEQVNSAKKIASSRPSVEGRHLLHESVTDNNTNIILQQNWPTIFNPFFGAIFASKMKKNSTGEPLSGKEIRKFLDGYKIETDYTPDLIVVGNDAAMLPFVEDTFFTAFTLEQSYLKIFDAKNNSFGLGIASLMCALDFIKLGRINWRDLIAENIK